MTQKKDTTNPSPKPTEKHPAAPDGKTVRKDVPESGGASVLLWFVPAAVLVGALLWAVERGYLDNLFTGDEEVMFTAAKPHEARDIERGLSNGFTEPEPVRASDEEISRLMANQERGRREREQLRRDLSRLQQDMTTLTEAVENALKAQAAMQAEQAGMVQANGATVDESSIREVEQRLAALTERLDGLQSDYNRQSAIYAARMKLLQAVHMVERKLADGESFREDVRLLERLASRADLPRDSISVLRSLADEQTLSRPALLQEFSQTAAVALPFGLRNNDEPSLGDAIRSNLSHIVSIRRVDVAADDNGDEAHIARAEAELRNGNVEMTIVHLEQLSAEPRAIFTGWLQQAKHYHDAHAAIARLKDAIMQNDYEG